MIYVIHLKSFDTFILNFFSYFIYLSSSNFFILSFMISELFFDEIYSIVLLEILNFSTVYIVFLQYFVEDIREKIFIIKIFYSN